MEREAGAAEPRTEELFFCVVLHVERSLPQPKMTQNPRHSLQHLESNCCSMASSAAVLKVLELLDDQGKIGIDLFVPAYFNFFQA